MSFTNVICQNICLWIWKYWLFPPCETQKCCDLFFYIGRAKIQKKLRFLWCLWYLKLWQTSSSIFKLLRCLVHSMSWQEPQLLWDLSKLLLWELRPSFVSEFWSCVCSFPIITFLQAIQRQLEELEERQRTLEIFGVELERELRGEAGTQSNLLV